jgi:hypothetical protein
VRLRQVCSVSLYLPEAHAAPSLPAGSSLVKRSIIYFAVSWLFYIKLSSALRIRLSIHPALIEYRNKITLYFSLAIWQPNF